MTLYSQHPFPLFSGQIAYLHLPERLTRPDANRLKAMIDSFVIDPDPCWAFCGFLAASVTS